MDQILFATGIYGFFGSILIVIFHILPEIKEVYSKRHSQFFIHKNEKEFSQAVKTYTFYSHIWSFRLISTGFLIMVIYSLWPKEYLNLPCNILFVVADSCLLFFVATWGITDVYKNSIGPRKEWLIAFYFGFSSGFYLILVAINHAYYKSTKIDFIDNILLISALISQLIFSALFVSRYKLLKRLDSYKDEMRRYSS
jgi:sensor histidine kinase YesM